MKIHSSIRSLIITILILACTSCNGLSSVYDSSVHPSESLIRALSDAPVAKITYRDDEGSSCGTVFYVGDNEFLTALHVLLDDENHVRDEARIGR